MKPIEPIAWRIDRAWSLPLIMLTVAMHVYGLGLVNEAHSRFLKSSAKRRRLATRLPLVVGTTALLVTCLHALKAGIWAAAYRLLGALPDAKTAMLYSLNALTSYGHESINLVDRWQLIGALEALNGWILFGLSTAFLFRIIRGPGPLLRSDRDFR
jgi:hypothetical protein